MNKTEKINLKKILTWEQKWHPSWWHGGVREVTIVLAVYIAYSLTQGSLAKSAGLAMNNAFNIIDLEKHLNIFLELEIQHWLLQSQFVTHLANYAYTFLYYPFLITFAIWAYKRHYGQYIIFRNIFLVSAAMGLLCFALYPVAPPRMLPDLGFADTMARYELIHYSPLIPSFLVNQYAAMPSFHFGWSLLAGSATALIATSWWLKVLGASMPLIMLISIIATGNHFILDALGGAAAVGIAYGIVSLLIRRNKYLQPVTSIDKKNPN